MNQSVIRSLTFADVRAFLIWEQRVVSSNPTAPTSKNKGLAHFDELTLFVFWRMRLQRDASARVLGVHQGHTGTHGDSAARRRHQIPRQLLHHRVAGL